MRSPHLSLMALAVAALACSKNGTPANTPANPAASAMPSSDTGRVRVWEDARTRGVSFRAVGQEPGWLLELTPGKQFHVVADYGEREVDMPVSDPKADEQSGRITFQSKTDGHTLDVQIDTAACQDAMSGESMTHTVTMTLDGKTYRGCGRTLATGSLTNTYWRAITIAGAPVVTGTRPVFIRLAEPESRMTGSTGCNSMFGQFTHSGDTIRFDAIGSTRMACLDTAAMAQEGRFTKTLTSVNRFGIGHDTLTLFQDKTEVLRFVAEPLR